MCRFYYDEQVVASFAYQIQSKYYGCNRSVSIEGMALYHFSDTKHPWPLSVPLSCTGHSVFRSFLYNDRKQDYATTTSHIKCIIGLLNNWKIIFSNLGRIWEDTGGSSKHYSRGFTEIGYVPKSREIYQKNPWCPFCFFVVL